MKGEGTIKWYQCKRDLSITVIILLIFGIAILHFDIYENFRKNIWYAVRSKYPNMIVNLFFDWGMWLPTLAVLIQSILVCLKHYWSWLIITLVGVSFFLAIDSSNSLEEPMKVIDILESLLTNLPYFTHFIDGIFTYVALSSPYVAIIAVIVLVIRKKYKIIRR